MTPFLTSKIGRIEKITIFSYILTKDIINQPEQLSKFKKWLTIADEINLYEFTEIGFKTFQPMKEESTWQYLFQSSLHIFPPYENTQLISSYISLIVRSAFEKRYIRYLRENAYITDIIDLSPCVLKKCIEFNVELFNSGKIFIHFLPSTKLTSPDSISIEYISMLKNHFDRPLKDIEVSLIDLKQFRRLKVDLFSSEDLEKASFFFKKNDNVICTFNYHFIASYSPEIYGKVVIETIKDIDKSIFYLKEKLSTLTFGSDFNFQDKPFARIAVRSLGKENNLLIGENKCVNKQSAAFYNGMYKSANNCAVLPVLVDNSKYFNFTELIYRFNKNSELFDLLEPMRINSTDELRFNELLKVKKELNKKFLVAIFSKYKQPFEFIEPLKKSKTSFQIYTGEIDDYKLSNFTVKCLEKLGGHLSIINSSDEDENTYFIGIDLGHSSNERGSFSNLALVFFDNRGLFLHSVINKNLNRNEAISSEVIWSSFASFGKFLKKKNKPYPEKLIIHRDGKLHKEDVKSIIKQSKKQLNVEEVEIVEIIKRGFPVFACFDQETYLNLNSGDYFSNEGYAILITNIQANERNAIVNPIIIKHKFGKSNMEKIVKQVYWFTKIYTNNLYNSTRLPATTLKANNIVGTSLKKYQATFKG